MAFQLTKLSQQEARKILESANLPGTINRDLKFAISSKSERLEALKDKKDSADARTAAAIEVQRVWRGYYARCKLFGILHPSVSSMKTIEETTFLPSIGRMSTVRTATPNPPHPTPQTAQVSPLLADKYKKYCEKKIASEGESTLLMMFTEFCAKIIQDWWRQLQLHPIPTYPAPPPPTTRGEMTTATPATQQPTPYESSPTPEVASTGRATTVSRDSRAFDRHEAARVIQRTWRKHIDIQVYRYYRDLISFRNRGDPSLMLRCINPREAALLEAGAGVHIKFRLAGERFPPNIYYKIFTHRNVADIGAFAPRNYTDADNLKLPPEYIHNKHDLGSQRVTISCYQRWENNGWRLVSDRLVKKADQDPVVYESTQKSTAFHHSKFQRKADLEKKRKKRKIEWMKKMYKQGMLQAKKDQDPDTQTIIETVAHGMVNAAETRGTDAVEDWEVDELLEWTSGLNFDEYLTNWKEYATSSGSEFLSAQTTFLPDDPFSLTLVS
ncbi:protein MFI [Nematostella vectensis]|uniref:protein MFI n=1 Tax=Nematostella vectensis TaxID=45351 RepID=UPI0013904A81|nr:protein MFI [Nematostella vectensis]